MSDDVREHGPRIKDCILDALVGDFLGRGHFRAVYALDDSRVLKVEDRARSFCNIDEWTIWQEAQGTGWEQWFAPCLHIDRFGSALIQARTKPLTDRQWKALKEVPSFMADVKRENWGWHQGRPVCHDYGNHLFFHRGFSRVKMKPRDRD